MIPKSGNLWEEDGSIHFPTNLKPLQPPIALFSLRGNDFRWIYMGKISKGCCLRVNDLRRWSSFGHYNGVSTSWQSSIKVPGRLYAYTGGGEGKNWKCRWRVSRRSKRLNKCWKKRVCCLLKSTVLLSHSNSPQQTGHTRIKKPPTFLEVIGPINLDSPAGAPPTE